MNMQDKIIYNWSSLDNSYTGESKAIPNPKVPGMFLIPARATDIKPPKLNDNETALFDEKESKWVVVPDYRNKAIYSIEDARPVLWAKVGALPKGYTEKERTDSSFAWNSTKKKWTPSKTLQTQNKLDQFLEEYLIKRSKPVEYNGSTFSLNTLTEINNALLVYEEIPKDYILPDIDYIGVTCTKEDLINISRLFQDRNKTLLRKYNTKKRNTEEA